MGNLLSRDTRTVFWGEAFTFWVVWSALLALAVFDISSLLHYDGSSRNYWHQGHPLSSAHLILYVMIGTILFTTWQNNIIAMTSKYALLFSSVIVIILINFYYLPRGAASVLILLLLMSIALFYGCLGHRKLFIFLTVLIGLRILFAYFEMMGSLALTGAGLIFSGLLIIAITLFWTKNINRLQAWIGALTK